MLILINDSLSRISNDFEDVREESEFPFEKSFNSSIKFEKVLEPSASSTKVLQTSLIKVDQDFIAKTVNVDPALDSITILCIVDTIPGTNETTLRGLIRVDLSYKSKRSNKISQELCLVFLEYCNPQISINLEM